MLSFCLVLDMYLTKNRPIHT